MFVSSDDDRESLRALAPRVVVNGRAIQSIADDPQRAPGIAAIGVTYDCARDAAIATAAARRR
jgi:4-hydroxybutyryl-CoA dehydratase/vinylacetyl-CoA-Delta-isomerase